MKQSWDGPVRPELKQYVAEATQALARLDAERLEELALSCEALNREVKKSSGADRSLLAREAAAAAGEMAILFRVLEATHSNGRVMRHLLELRAGRVEYGLQQCRKNFTQEKPHGDD
ncbi:MAG TPA: hypothetical protein VMV57_10960 [Terracidiphilus sp.]|nr:hypothetical protein [Terracidiphilus sp.]